MQLPSLSFGLLGLLAAQATATSLTYKLEANEKACFYTATQNKDEKIAFYFAVCAPESETFDNDQVCWCSPMLTMA